MDEEVKDDAGAAPENDSESEKAESPGGGMEEQAASQTEAVSTREDDASKESDDNEDKPGAARQSSESGRADSVAVSPPRTGQPRRNGPAYGRGNSRGSRSGGSEGRPRRSYFRRKVCRLCVNKIKEVDYKDVDMLRRFVTDRGKILPRRMTGTCAKHQRMLSGAIKRARMVAFLPYVRK